MTKNKLVVCDLDEAYVEAFAAYLLEKLEDVEISTYTNVLDFKRDQNKMYDVGILGKEFLEVLERDSANNILEKLYLCDERIASEYEYLPMVYKFQSMEIVEEMLRRIQMRVRKSQWEDRGKSQGAHIIGIYSPISHELQMPFGLALCQTYSEQGKVLYVDIEELSIMQSLMCKDGGKNMQDLFYYLKQDKEIEIEEFVSSFMGVDYLRPFNNPEELNEVSKEDWEKFFSIIKLGGYDNVVVLFGRTIQGFSNIIRGYDELIVLSKQGDYYDKSRECFCEYLKKIGVEIELKNMVLPMSASNLTMGNYVLEELVQGNLGMYVRRQLLERKAGVVHGVA